MSKRTPAKSSKRARSPAIATRAHGKKQTIVKSARDNLLRSVAAGPIESPLELHDDPKEQAPDVEKQEAPIAVNQVQVGPSQIRFGLQPEACDDQVAIPICRRDCRIYKKTGRHVGEAVNRNGCTHKTMTSSRSAPPRPTGQHLSGCRAKFWGRPGAMQRQTIAKQLCA